MLASPYELVWKRSLAGAWLWRLIAREQTVRLL